MIIPSKYVAIFALVLAVGVFCHLWGELGSFKKAIIELIKIHFE